MSTRTASVLYDALQVFESCRRNGTAYPVHKKLVSSRLGAGDIYDWIIDQTTLPAGGSILDAGCGVGFGTIRLAERSTCRVTGITVSGKELAAAREAAAQSNVSRRVRFARMSFDELPVELPAETYDVIVAVESLKHSADLSASLASLRRALRPGGKLVVVEDLYAGAEDSVIARRVTRDWGLRRLYRECDYIEGLGARLGARIGARIGAQSCRVADLSNTVRRAHKVTLLAKLAWLAALRPFIGVETAEVLRAFRGGLYLDWLYAEQSVGYKAILLESKDSVQQ